MLAIGLTLAAYVSESFQLTFEGAVAAIVEAPPSGGEQRLFTPASL